MLLNILTETQVKILGTVATAKTLSDRFYLTGGTALAGYYLGHRYSEDLDFFSLHEIDPMAIDVFLKQNKSEIGFDSYEYQQSMNRNLYFLKFGEEEVKMEFTYFPFTQIEKPRDENGLKVYSINYL